MKRIILVFTTLLLTFLTGCSLIGGSTSTSSIAELRQKYAADQDFLVQDKIYTIQRNEGIEVETTLSEFGNFKSKEGTTATPIVIYSDYEFRNPIYVPLEDIGSDGTISISPMDFNGSNLRLPGNDSFYLTGNGSWGIYDTLYMVQYNDMDTGELLEKPYVYLINIQDENQLANPVVTMDVTGSGQLSLTWDKVEGASSYIVVQQLPNTEEPNPYTPGNYAYMDVYTTTDTYRLSDKRDAVGMETFYYSDDDRNDPALANDLRFIEMVDKKRSPYYFFVIAVDGYGKASSQSNYFSSDTFASKIPIRRAVNTYKKIYGEKAYQSVEGIENIPLTYPVIMADGKVRDYLLDLDLNHMDRSENKQKNTYAFTLPYKIKGTPLEDQLYVNDGSSDYQSKLEAKTAEINAYNLNGSLNKFVSVEPVTLENIDTKLISDKLPSVEYKVFASTSLGEYLAANLANGYEYIDLGQFPESTDPNVLNLTLTEITEQNAFLPLIVNYYYSKENHLLQIKYNNFDEKRIDELREKSLQVTKDILQESMTDLEKAAAINKYLIDTVTYNYDAIAKLDEVENLSENTGYSSSNQYMDLMREYGDVFEAQGAMLDGSAVCAGYAKAFNILAMQSGLDSMYVVGEAASGKGHAWNYVLIDDEWKAFDITWNDSEDSALQQKYFNLSLSDPLYTSTHFPSAKYEEFALKK